MPKVCLYRPNRSTPRLVDEKSAARFYCQCRKRGITHKKLLDAIEEKCGKDPCRRKRVRRSARIMSNSLAQAAQDLRTVEENFAIVLTLLIPIVLYLRTVARVLTRKKGETIAKAKTAELLLSIRRNVAEAEAQAKFLERIYGVVKEAEKSVGSVKSG